MRVTGDCLRADLVFFFLDADGVVVELREADFFALPERAETFDTFLPFGPAPARDFDAAFFRGAARFDAPDDFRRVLPPDDFDPVAMISSSRKVRLGTAQDSRAVSRSMMRVR
jgi:hypothetical protein